MLTNRRNSPVSISEIHSYWICPVCWGVAAMIGVALRDRGAGLTQLKSGAWSAFVGICRPVLMVIENPRS